MASWATSSTKIRNYLRTSPHRRLSFAVQTNISGCFFLSFLWMPSWSRSRRPERLPYCFDTVENATKLLAGQALILGISSDFSHIPDLSEYDAHNLVIPFTYLFKIFGHTPIRISACLDFWITTSLALTNRCVLSSRYSSKMVLQRQFHRIPEWLRLEGTSKGHLIQSLCSRKAIYSQLPSTTSRELLSMPKEEVWFPSLTLWCWQCL